MSTLFGPSKVQTCVSVRLLEDIVNVSPHPHILFICLFYHFRLSFLLLKIYIKSFAISFHYDNNTGEEVNKKHSELEVTDMKLQCVTSDD